MADLSDVSAGTGRRRPSRRPRRRPGSQVEVAAPRREAPQELGV